MSLAQLSPSLLLQFKPQWLSFHIRLKLTENNAILVPIFIYKVPSMILLHPLRVYFFLSLDCCFNYILDTVHQITKIRSITTSSLKTTNKRWIISTWLETVTYQCVYCPHSSQINLALSTQSDKNQIWIRLSHSDSSFIRLESDFWSCWHTHREFLTGR